MATVRPTHFGPLEDAAKSDAVRSTHFGPLHEDEEEEILEVLIHKVGPNQITGKKLYKLSS